jgi:hypothetical protein
MVGVIVTSSGCNDDVANLVPAGAVPDRDRPAG